MKLSEDDKKILKELCEQHKVSYEKVIKLIETEKEYVQRNARVGIYDALKEIIKQK
jgi:hypothetical protein